MKADFIMSCVSVLNACGTVGGAMQGAGEDLNAAGTWVRSVGK